MDDVLAKLKLWLAYFSLREVERKPELEQEYIRASHKLLMLEKRVWATWYDGRKRQNVLSNAVAEKWKLQRKLIVAGYKDKDILKLNKRAMEETK